MATDRDSTLDGDQITDRTIKQLELDFTNTPTDGQILKINMPDGDFTAIDLGDIGDITTMQTNIVLNAFRIAINGSLTQFNMVDGIVDEYEDENSIDNPNSTNESYDSVNDLYSPNKDTLSVSPFSHMLLEDNTDVGSGANAVTDIGTPTYTSGKLNNALTLNGTDQALNIDALEVDIDSDTTGSFAFWFTSGALDATRAMLNIGDSGGGADFFKIGVRSTDELEVVMQVGSTRQWRHRSAISASTQYHVVVVQDGVSPVVYLDGVDITTLTETIDVTAWLADSEAILDNGRIGCSNNGTNNLFFDGQIDDFRYYQNIVLTQADVDLLYNSGTGTEATNPEGTPENITLISDPFTAETTPTNIRIVLFEEDVDSVTLNTDLKAFATRDAGQTFTTDFATDDKLDITSHGFANDDRIMVTSSAQDLSAGLDSATVYYVINQTANDFELSLTSGGSAVDITDNGTGTHTAKQVTEITLANDGEYESGKNILTGSVDISGQPSGTSMEYQLVTANNKDLNIHGTGLSWD